MKMVGGNVGNLRLHSFVFTSFFIGYFFYLEKLYASKLALLMAFVVTILIYMLPLALIMLARNKGCSITIGALLGTMWEFGMAVLVRTLTFPVWRSFLLAGIGGALTVIFLVFVRRNENVIKGKTL